jgi:NADPH:quinone reductase-like Zn-dependent oxidoreductase
MRAALLKELGGTPQVGDFDDPPGAEDGVVVEISVAGMNPVDLTTAAGVMGERPLPSVVGREGIGTAGGKRYWFQDTVDPFGSFAERTLVAPDELVEVPDGVDDGLAVSFGIAGLAAWLALEWRAQLREGESVLVLGASGVVGQVGVQAAKLLGAGRVVAAARNEEMLDHALELGADAVVNIDVDGVDAIRERLAAESRDGWDVIVDPLWGDPAVAALKTIAMGGRLVHLGNSAGTEAEINGRDVRSKQASILGHVTFNVPTDVRAPAFQRMCRHGADGELRVEVKEYALADVAEAWEAQKTGPHHKLVIRP